MGLTCSSSGLKFWKSNEKDDLEKLSEDSEEEDEEESVLSEEPSKSVEEIPKATPIKALLLGSGESGKSTISKQCTRLYGPGISEDERKEYKFSIIENIIDDWLILIENSRFLGDDDESCVVDPELQDEIDHIEELDDKNKLSKKTVQSLLKLWEDEGIKNTYSRRHEYQLNDSLIYFMESIERISERGYIPIFNDITHLRERTIGLTKQEANFTVGNLEYTFIIHDVGGQKTERSKWENIFTNVNVVIFVVEAPGFIKTCFENNDLNRLDDSLAVYEMVINAKPFVNTRFLLLFNKMDMFREMIDSGIKFTYKNYDGEQEVDAIIEYMSYLFEQKNHTSKPVITKSVCALSDDFNLDQELRHIIEQL